MVCNSVTDVTAVTFRAELYKKTMFLLISSLVYWPLGQSHTSTTRSLIIFILMRLSRSIRKTTKITDIGFRICKLKWHLLGNKSSEWRPRTRTSSVESVDGGSSRKFVVVFGWWWWWDKFGTLDIWRITRGRSLCIVVCLFNYSTLQNLKR